ncbi:MAG: hypothetical protein LAT51_02395 [Flavobacteriaceae bacterium]|nr:hypothetical protein [Flavobacteriaceae bacterium]
MKKILSLLCLLSFFGLFAQNQENRIIIQGKVNVPLDAEAKGIHVYNVNLGKGVLTDDIGKFAILVKNGDELIFSALQYEDFKLMVDENIVEAKKITVSLRESVEPLDDVYVRPYDLSGNIEVDVARVKITDFQGVSEDAKKAIFAYEGDFAKDSRSPITKAVVDEQFVEYGLDVANVFRAIFKRTKNNKEVPEDLDVTIRKMYDDEFFNEYLNIERSKINQFIYFAQDNGLSQTMLEEKHELELIEFLVTKSVMFKNLNKN